MIILFAEDDLEQQVLYKDCFLQHNNALQFFFAQNGFQLLTMLAKADMDRALPDLIILDLNMPHIGGREVLADLAKDLRYSSIPVVILTESNLMMDHYLSGLFRVPFFQKHYTTEGCMRVTQNILEWHYSHAAGKEMGSIGRR
ncbi:Response regulator receiver domain-containing protein [Cnuella takakiae]|uniref:Response regulator receiver domain-containing protein n=1 Tax=Cnuella takakiae TaxID=1302690 RepID=A0A1M4Z9T0_9BACT|nr:response regulator [Cnuella takakiae]OLY94283.1 hypothetical protein BUE76_22135 [Cnuella takakiae]SHF14735.1 Response regulator receiver domain-containing protein [Cnuella takakiae]